MAIAYWRGGVFYFYPTHYIYFSSQHKAHFQTMVWVNVCVLRPVFVGLLSVSTGFAETLQTTRLRKVNVLVCRMYLHSVSLWYHRTENGDTEARARARSTTETRCFAWRDWQQLSVLLFSWVQNAARSTSPVAISPFLRKRKISKKWRNLLWPACFVARNTPAVDPLISCSHCWPWRSTANRSAKSRSAGDLTESECAIIGILTQLHWPT